MIAYGTLGAPEGTDLDLAANDLRTMITVNTKRLVVAALALLPAIAGAASLRFYGNGGNDADRVKIPVDPQVPADIGATNFTIEFWMKGTLADNDAGGAARCGDQYGWIDAHIIVDRDRLNVGRSFGISVSRGTGRLAFGVQNASFDSWTVCGTRGVLDGQWHHVAVQRTASSGALAIYVDGSLDASVNSGPTGDISYPNGATGQSPDDPFLVLGAEKHDADPPRYPSFSGLLDELRLSTTLRYSGSYSVPSAPFTPDASTAALYHFDDGAAGTPCATNTVIVDATSGSSNGLCRFGRWENWNPQRPEGPVWSADTPFANSPGAVQFTQSQFVAAEGAGNAAIVVSRTGGVSGAASVTVDITAGTATQGADYTVPVSRTLSWNSGVGGNQTLNIPVLDDSEVESTETVQLSLSGSVGATLGSPGTATLSITDNDTPPAAGTLQFTEQTFPFNESAGSATISVSRANGSNGAASVTVTIAQGSATAGADYAPPTSGALSWAAGASGAQTLTIDIIEDVQAEPTETVLLSLGDATGAALGSPANATLQIVDNDSPSMPGVLQFSQANVSVPEAGGSVSLTVSRSSGTDGSVVVSYATANGTAQAGSDYTVRNETLTFADGVTSRTLSVPIESDVIDESDETFTVTLSNPTNNATLGATTTASVTIVDDDGTPAPPPTGSSSGGGGGGSEDPLSLLAAACACLLFRRSRGWA